MLFFASAVPVVIATMAAYQDAGEPIVRDKEKGVWKRYLVTPVSNWDLVIGDVISGTAKAIVASTLAYAITVILIGPSYIGAIGIINGFFIILISVIGWVGFSVLVASRMKYNTYYSLGMLMNLLIFATSGMFYPIEGLPIWFRVLSYVNPLTYTVEAFRGMMLRGLTILDLGTNFFFLLLFSVAMILAGVLSLRRRIE
jgi:ABC-2 type transport system permease protein